MMGHFVLSMRAGLGRRGEAQSPHALPRTQVRCVKEDSEKRGDCRGHTDPVTGSGN